jgi:thiamine-monophosphate kinase
VTEDQLVAEIRALGDGLGNRRLVVGIGDDAAVWQPSRSHRSVISTDISIEAVHFRRDLMSLEDAGWRSMAANLSDLAAMGARPVLATVAIGIPADNAERDVTAIYRGIVACAKRYGIAIAGGDLSRSAAITIAITVVGEVRPSNLKLRSGSHPGDVLAVTGELGAARAGLLGETEGLEAFRRPQPRIAEGRFLAASANVRAMMDCSDGLCTDLARLCVASGCGATLESVPVASAARAAAARDDEDAETFALRGGEDFELLLAVRASAFSYLASRFEKRFKRPLLRIGVLQNAPGIQWRQHSLTASGWDHFQ